MPAATEVGDAAGAVMTTGDTHVVAETATTTAGAAADAPAPAPLATAVVMIAIEATAVTETGTAAVAEMMTVIGETAHRNSTKMSEIAVPCLCNSSRPVCGLVS